MSTDPKTTGTTIPSPHDGSEKRGLADVAHVAADLATVAVAVKALKGGRK